MRLKSGAVGETLRNRRFRRGSASGPGSEPAKSYQDLAKRNASDRATPRSGGGRRLGGPKGDRSGRNRRLDFTNAIVGCRMRIVDCIKRQRSTRSIDDFATYRPATAFTAEKERGAAARWGRDSEGHVRLASGALTYEKGPSTFNSTPLRAR